jgi:hypothetical protein
MIFVTGEAMMIEESISAYPLQFPPTQKRSPGRRSQFKVTFAEARDELLQELNRLGVQSIVLFTNIELKRDGLPYATRAEPADPGVALYFFWRNNQYCFACDKWDRAKDNIRAIYLHIQALRGQQRWGVGTTDQAFAGYRQLPAQSSGGSWRTVLEVPPEATAQEIQLSYRRLAKLHHPDNGGDRRKFEQINSAYKQAKSEADKC